MHTPRFYCPQLSPGVLTLDQHEARHALQSLRLRVGAAVELFDGRGNLGRGVICQPDSQAPDSPLPRRTRSRLASLAVSVAQVTLEPAPPHRLNLVVAGCKGPRLDWLVEKCTEMGVSGLTLANFERSVVQTGPRHVGRLTRTAIEACKQCRRTRLPDLQAGLGLAETLSSLGEAMLLAAHPHAAAVSVAECIRSRAGLPRELVVLIGPEGGFSSRELDQLSAAGARMVCLGPHILRIETAAVAIASQWAGAVIATRD
jgi:16S rRNA (uracil1498-N3)-methyltransferase